MTMRGNEDSNIREPHWSPCYGCHCEQCEEARDRGEPMSPGQLEVERIDSEGHTVH